jgi:hypothetical protein
MKMIDERQLNAVMITQGVVVWAVSMVVPWIVMLKGHYVFRT